VRPRGTWLLATVGDRVLDDPRAKRFFLDSVVPDHPVVLESWSGHAAIFNSATLGTLGIGHDTPDPPGGRYGRVPGSEVLDGRLTEYAWWNARRRLSSSVPDSASRADLLRYADAAARFGITTVQDMNNNLTTARAVALLRDADVPIRWRVIRFPITRPGGRAVGDARAAGPRPGRPRGVSGATSTPAPESTWHALRPRIEHGDFLAADLVPSARRLGVVVVQNPARFTILVLIRRRYGPGRAGVAQPLRSLLTAGVRIALGSDGPM